MNPQEISAKMSLGLLQFEVRVWLCGLGLGRLLGHILFLPEYAFAGPLGKVLKHEDCPGGAEKRANPVLWPQQNRMCKNQKYFCICVQMGNKRIYCIL